MTTTDLYLMDDYNKILHVHAFENEDTQQVLSILSVYLFFYMMFFVSILGLLLSVYEQRIVKLENKIVDLEEEIDDLTPITFDENKSRDNERWTMED